MRYLTKILLINLLNSFPKMFDSKINNIILSHIKNNDYIEILFI